MCNIRCRFNKLNRLLDPRKSQGITGEFSILCVKKMFFGNTTTNWYPITYIYVILIFLFQHIL